MAGIGDAGCQMSRVRSESVVSQGGGEGNRSVITKSESLSLYQKRENVGSEIIGSVERVSKAREAVKRK